MSALAGSLLGGGSSGAKVAADGTFTIGGIAPGRYRLNTPFGLIPIPGMNADDRRLDAEGRDGSTAATSPTRRSK